MRSSKLRLAGLTAALLVLAPVGSVSAADVYELDAAHSVVMFKVSHLGYATAYGRFNDFDGSFSIDEANPSASSVTFEIKTASVDTANQRRDDHLRGPDFFNSKQFPVASFQSTKVSKKDDLWHVTGDLSLHGVTKEVTIELKRNKTGDDPWGKYRTGFDGTFTIDRNEFGVSYMPGALGDEVTLIIAVEGVRK